ncbi:MAG: protein kinase domain-containing protein [Bryobacteraceae bacterium]
MLTRVEQIFHEVVDLPVESRAQYFIENRIEEQTRREVEGLIAFDSDTATSFSRDIGEMARLVVGPIDATGTRCGPYQLTSLLGRGGMGAVYLAERVDGELRQEVAVKLLSHAAADPELLERFLTERQILASISQPNIARLLDAGHREDGQPYLVMEYVKGSPIDVFTAELGVRQKVSLFLKVCAAVAYLHRHLVVHRDLKPNNIFVTDEGEPKLLDFGIAKMLDLTTDCAVTSIRILTPDYASPEQASGTPVTTATDIYSLGAVLYKLLTGASPHQFERDAVGNKISVIPTGKVTPPSKLMPILKRDLDFILLKTLRQDPRERYTTVEQLADDLENYLESRPIRARKGDVWYRTLKLLRRRWIPVTATLLVIASLSIGLYVANRERVLAERRFAQLRQLSKRVIDLDSAIRTLPGSVAARRRLVAASLEYLEGLSPEARGDMDLAEEIADGYWRMARIQGVNAEFNLGDPAKAEDSLKKADDLIDSVLASREDRGALFRSALIAHDRMILADTEDRRADVFVHTRRTVERLEAFSRQRPSGNHPVYLDIILRPGDPQSELSSTALLYTNVALTYVNRHLYAEGVRYAQRAADIVKPIASAQDVLAGCLSLLANALRYQGDLDAALNNIRQAREISEKATYASETARFFSQYGPIYREGLILGGAEAVSLGRPAEAIEVFQQALDSTDAAARKDANDAASRGRVGTVARELGDILRDRDPGRALAVYDLGIQRLGEIKAGMKTGRDYATLLAKSSYALRRLGRASEAKRRIDSSLEILKNTKEYPTERILLSSPVCTVLRALGDYEAESDDQGRGLAIYEQLLQKVMASKPDALNDLRDTPKMSSIYAALSHLYRRVGDSKKAELMKSQRIELWRHWQRVLPQNNYIRGQLGAAEQDS